MLEKDRILFEELKLLEGVSTIPLTRGLEALIDTKNLSELSAHKWCAHGSENKGIYAARSNYPNGVVLMHKQILHTEYEVDHHNGLKLDNRECNLREATRSDNCINRDFPKWSVNKSKYRGVWWHNPRLWRVGITKDYIKYDLGLFSSEEDAARAYDKAALELHGEFARTNF